MNKIITQWLTQIRQQPYKVRVRILWGATLALALVILIGWGFSLRREIAKTDRLKLSHVKIKKRLKKKYV